MHYCLRFELNLCALNRFELIMLHCFRYRLPKRKEGHQNPIQHRKQLRELKGGINKKQEKHQGMRLHFIALKMLFKSIFTPIFCHSLTNLLMKSVMSIHGLILVHICRNNYVQFLCSIMFSLQEQLFQFLCSIMFSFYVQFCWISLPHQFIFTLQRSLNRFIFQTDSYSKHCREAQTHIYSKQMLITSNRISLQILTPNNLTNYTNQNKMQHNNIN